MFDAIMVALIVALVMTLYEAWGMQREEQKKDT